MDLLTKIKNCQTMRSLDELRSEFVQVAESGADVETLQDLQKAFIKKKNSLKRHGHTRRTEGYSIRDIL